MSLFHAALQPALDDNGDPLSGAVWKFYRHDTLTPASVYADYQYLVSLGTSVEADAGGNFPDIYLDDLIAYRGVLETAGGTVRRDIDPLDPDSTLIEALAASDGASLIGYGDETVESALDDLDGRVDTLEGTIISGIRAYETYADLDAAFDAYNGATAYDIDDTVLNQAAFWINIQASTGNAPPTLPTTSNAYWQLVTAAPGGIAAYVSASDVGTHTDPVVGGTVDNAGVYRWSSADEDWERIFDLDSMIAEGFADDAEAAAAILGGAASLGEIPTKPDDVAGNVEWQDRQEIGEQPTKATATSTTSEVQFFNQIATPGTRATLASAGGVLTITAGASIGSNIPSCIVGTTQLLNTGFTYIVEGRMTVLPSIQTGLIFGFLNGAPSAGGATAVTPAGSCLITMRGNGTLVMVDTAGAAFSGGTITVPSGGSPGSVSEFTTEVVRLIVTMTSTTTARCVPVIGGVAQEVRIITGLPAGCYFGGGLRIADVTCAGEISQLAAKGVSLDVVKRLHIDPSAAATGGDGSRDDPMKTLDEAQFSADVDYARRSLRIALLGGTLRGTISIDGSRWDEIDIRSAPGQQTIIKPSVLITSGWTLVPGSTGGAVYKRLASDAFYAGNPTYGGYVDVTSGVTQSDIYGPVGYQYTVEGWALYSRLAADTAANDAAFVPGSYSRQYASADAGYDFIRCWDDGDPNDKDFERSIYGAGIDIYPSEEEGWTGPKVTIRNVEVHYPFLYGVRANACDVDIQNVYVRGSQVGYGFELDGSGGRIVGCRAEGCGYDGLHAAGDMDAEDREVHLEIVDFHADGIAFLPQGFGDGISAHLHNRHRWTVIGGRARGVGKDGAAMSGESRFYNYHVIGAVGAGITAYAQVGVLFDNSTITVEGGIIQGCAQGINANCATIADASRTIDVTGTILLDNDVSILAYAAGGGTAVATVNAVGVQQDNCGAMDSATGGVINTRLSPTLV